MAESVTLSDVEYYKVMALAQAVQLASYQHQGAIRTAKIALEKAEAVRNAYLGGLEASYPALDFTACVYTGNDETLTLIPEVKVCPT